MPWKIRWAFNEALDRYVQTDFHDFNDFNAIKVIFFHFLLSLLINSMVFNFFFNYDKYACIVCRHNHTQSRLSGK